MSKRPKKRGLATAFVCKRRVRRFIADEKLNPLRRGVPGTLWEVVQSKIREELARGQIALPL